jgi:molybdopterin adenylyltransferase
MKKLGILVVSDRASQGGYKDLSGPAIAAWAGEAGLDVAALEVVPDEQDQIEEKLKAWSDSRRMDLILTSGGTGLGPRDVTPEATGVVIEREARGIPEWLRIASAPGTPRAALSRAVAGLRGRTLIVNLPGSPQAVQEWLETLEPILHHAFVMVEGKTHEKEACHSHSKETGDG